MGKEEYTDLNWTYIQRSGPAQVGSTHEGISTWPLLEVSHNVCSLLAFSSGSATSTC